MILINLVRIVYGLVEFALPDALGRAVLGHKPDPEVRTALGVLGARDVVQGVATIVSGGRLARLGRAVDLIHAASMLALAAADPKRRRAALTSAAIAGIFAAAAHR